METNQNPLDCDLTQIDTSMPLLAPATLDLKIAKVELKKTKDGLTDMLNIEHKTVDMAKSVKDETLHPGVTLFNTLCLQPRGALTAEMVRRSGAELAQAAKVDPTFRFLQHYKTLEGKVVRAKVEVAPEGVDKNGKAFRAKNVVAYYVKQ